MASRELQKIIKKPKIVFSLLLILLVLVYDLGGFGGNIRFYAKWIECGVRPIVPEARIGFGASVPNYVDAPAFSLFRGAPVQFCSPREAEMAGYSASSRVYSYPHLSDKERECLALMRNSLPYDMDTCSNVHIVK